MNIWKPVAVASLITLGVVAGDSVRRYQDDKNAVEYYSKEVKNSLPDSDYRSIKKMVDGTPLLDKKRNILESAYNNLDCAGRAKEAYRLGEQHIRDSISAANLEKIASKAATKGYKILR